MKDWNKDKITYRAVDNSYVVFINKLPYHVPNEGEWADLWTQVDEYAKEHPEVVTEEAPYVAPEPTPEELAARALEQAKAERAAAVASITVEVDGMVFDGDEKAQERMARTVTAATATGASMDETTVWVLHDNTVATVTVRQLATALRMAGEAQTALWTVPYES
jgi:biopolymer transport protein ExbD